MRIAKTFGVRTATPKEVRRKFILVFEGEKTEYQYFKGIDEYKAEIGISGLVDIKQLLRSAREKSTSNPKRVIQQLIKHLKETVASGMSCDSLIKRICDFIFYDLEITEDSIFSPKVIHDDLLAFSEQTIGLSPESIITDVNALLGKFEDPFKATYNVENAAEQIKAYLANSEVIFDKNFDKVCIIVDRDRQSFKADQYDYVVDQCQIHGFDLFVSNPCFEFWLLLHYAEIDKLDRPTLLANPKVTTKKSFTEKMLSERLQGYKKNDLKFDKIKGGIDLAIEQEKQFCQELVGLRNELGSNVGLLIGEMRR